MIIVISHPEPVKDEALWINRLFDAGLEVFHLRKAGMDQLELENFINTISEAHREKISFHGYNNIVQKTSVINVHLKVEERKKYSDYQLIEMKIGLNRLSTSIHHPDEYARLCSAFDYCFLGPVFNSISKKEYTGKGFTVNDLNKGKIKIVAIGGINEENISEIKNKGYDGAALLGSIWNQTDPVAGFQKIRKQWKSNEHIS